MNENKIGNHIELNQIIKTVSNQNSLSIAYEKAKNINKNKCKIF